MSHPNPKIRHLCYCVDMGMKRQSAGTDIKCVTCKTVMRTLLSSL